jgi:hypothetical protein
VGGKATRIRTPDGEDEGLSGEVPSSHVPSSPRRGTGRARGAAGHATPLCLLLQ